MPKTLKQIGEDFGKEIKNAADMLKEKRIAWYRAAKKLKNPPTQNDLENGFGDVKGLGEVINQKIWSKFIKALDTYVKDIGEAINDGTISDIHFNSQYSGSILPLKKSVVNEYLQNISKIKVKVNDKEVNVKCHCYAFQFVADFLFNKFSSLKTQFSSSLDACLFPTAELLSLSKIADQIGGYYQDIENDTF